MLVVLGVLKARQMRVGASLLHISRNFSEKDGYGMYIVDM